MPLLPGWLRSEGKALPKETWGGEKVCLITCMEGLTDEVQIMNILILVCYCTVLWHKYLGVQVTGLIVTRLWCYWCMTIWISASSVPSQP